MERIVVLTGVTGHSGKYAIERLAERRDALTGVSFRAVVRASSDTSILDESGLPIEKCVGDIRDDAFLARVLTGAETLLHIVGIMDSVQVVTAALNAGVRWIICVHTTGIYSKYKNAGQTYREIDQTVTELCRARGASLTILRPTMIYGGTDDQNVITFIRMMDRLPVMPTVSGARFALQPVHRRDLGHAYADVLLARGVTEGKNYVLSGREPILLRDMLTVIAGYLGKTPRFFSVPYPAALFGAWCVYLLALTKVDLREKVQRLVEPRAYPHEEATRDFGYAPVGFAEGVRGEVDAYLAAKAKGV